jgi:hypothetical protein
MPPMTALHTRAEVPGARLGDRRREAKSAGGRNLCALEFRYPMTSSATFMIQVGNVEACPARMDNRRLLRSGDELHLRQRTRTWK